MLEELDGREPALGYYRFARAEPAPQLQPFVREYIGYVDQAVGCVRRRELPVADTVIIINLGASWSMLDPASARLIGRFDSFAAGVSGQFSLVESTGHAHCPGCTDDVPRRVCALARCGSHR